MPCLPVLPLSLQRLRPPQRHPPRRPCWSPPPPHLRASCRSPSRCTNGSWPAPSPPRIRRCGCTQRREALFSAAVHQTRIEPEDVATFAAIWDQPNGEQTVTKILTQLKPKVHTFSAGYTGDPNQPPPKDPRRPGEITDDDVKEQMAFIGLPYTGKGK